MLGTYSPDVPKDYYTGPSGKTKYLMNDAVHKGSLHTHSACLE